MQAIQRITPRSDIDWPLVIFFVSSYALAWGIALYLASIAKHAGLQSWTELAAMAEVMEFDNSTLPLPAWSLYGLTRVQDFSFSICGLALIAYLHGISGLKKLGQRLLQWRMPWKWWLLALLPMFLYLLAMFVAGATSSFTLSAQNIYTGLFSLEAGLVVTFFLRGPMGEELGLRGFALPRLQQRMSAFKASVIIGALWALWHLPVLIDRNIVSIIIFLLLAFTLSFLFTALFNGSAGSLLPGLVFHSFQNNEETFEALFPALVGSNWELTSSILLLVAGISAGIYLWSKQRFATTENPFPTKTLR